MVDYYVEYCVCYTSFWGSRLYWYKKSKTAGVLERVLKTRRSAGKDDKMGKP